MSEETDDPWRGILSEAITANSTGPVIGTHFRNAVRIAASKRGLQFPPVEEPELRFVQLLERYPDVVSLLRRPGQDFLVVPPGRSDLLAAGIQQQPYGIRRDLFVAFTLVSDRRPYYDKAADGVLWKGPGEANSLPESLVPIEPATEEAEIQLRSDFANTVPEQRKSPLLTALSNPHPLQVFGRKVKEAGLQRSWHIFRTERMVGKIQRWASLKQIEWKDAWLTERPPDYYRKMQASSSEAPIREAPIRVEGDPLKLLFSALDAADIQRISIPLDLVLKAISPPKKR